MDVFASALAANPMQTRQDAVTALLDLIRPLKAFYSAGGALLKVGNTAAHYGEKDARMEGWARILWGLGPLFGGDNTALPADQQAEIAAWADLYRAGLVHGTDPSHSEYWGDIFDYDQKMVETAALDLALCLAPDVLWTPLTDAQKQNVYCWLNQMNAHRIRPNNWRFFRILTNMTFARLGLPYDTDQLKDDFGVVEHCYTGGGWYFDGNPGQMDYYIPFAMHFYSLIWSALSPLDADGCAAKLKARSGEFAGDFIQWFADDGAEIPFGRSLTYRFAHAAFFAAYAFAGAQNESIPWGAVRHTVLANLHHWFQYPITDAAGVLTIGYQYPNLLMSEQYNAPGSPYWAFKAFLFLALPADHPFWTAPDATVPHPVQQRQDKPHMLVCHDGGHITVFPVGQHCMNHGAISAKYEKFVYSNRFGFSVGRGTDLKDGAFDNTLAASPAGMNFYRMRYGTDDFAVTDAYTYAAYTLLPGTTAQSWVVPCGGSWHVRVHKIVTTSPIDIADGGFALSVEEPFTRRIGAEDGKVLLQQVEDVSGGKAVFLPWGCTAAVSLLGGAQAEFVRTFPNTNLMANLCAVPYLKAALQPGTHILVDAFYARPADADERGGFAAKPFAVRKGNAIEISCADGHTIRIDLEG